MSRTVHQIKVTLRGTRPPIWRRILVYSDVTLYKLHEILQVAMGWTDNHLHQYRVTVRYVDGVPREVTAVVCSAQHAEDVKRNTLAEGIIEEVIPKIIPANLVSRKVKFYIN